MTEPTIADLYRELRELRAEVRAIAERDAKPENSEELDEEPTRVRPKQTARGVSDVERLLRRKGVR